MVFDACKSWGIEKKANVEMNKKSCGYPAQKTKSIQQPSYLKQLNTGYVAASL